jgi:multiple antibiotic resistance protein MarB
LLIACTRRIEEKMKLFASAALTLLVLVSGQSFAEQSTHPANHASRDTMIMPSAQDRSPFDFTHMDAGSDKSDELGVAYYNGNAQ